MSEKCVQKKITEFTCIVCPVGCTLNVTVEEGNNIKVLGNKCPKGAEYALREVTDPQRYVQSTVVLLGSKTERRLPVKTDKPVPKDRIFDVIREIRKVKVNVPVKVGDVVLKDVLGLDVNVVATRTVEE